VTIGCPFDLVRAVRPDYFTGRRQLVGAPKQWLNVYTPNDILGSNFRNDDLAEQPEPEVIANAIGAGPSGDDPPLQPVNLAYHPGGVPPGSGFLDILVFSGFRAHAQYWDAGTSGEETCFDEIITRLYPDHLLAEPAAPAPA
jgi:hypothetical protein